MRRCLGMFFLMILWYASAAAQQGTGWTVGSAYNGQGSILYTNDSGQSWAYQGIGQIADVDLSGVYAVNGMNAYVVGDVDGGYATVYRTTDAGATWNRLGTAADLPGVDLVKIDGYGNRKLWVVGVGAIVRSADGGATWNNVCPAGYADTLFQGVTTTDGYHVWATGGNKDDYPTILYSADGGVSWTRQGTAESDVARVDHIIGISAADNKKLWAVGGGTEVGNVVLATTDGGATWVMVNNSGLGDGNEISAVDATTVWAAMDNFVQRSVDGGATWSSYSTNFATKGISGISADQAWAASNGARRYPGSIYFTADGGATWTATSTGPDGAGLPYLETIAMSTTTKEVYPQAVENAKAHADAPAGWVAAPSDMVKVSGATSVGANPHGLTFYGDPAKNRLIVRTLSSSNAYNGAWGTSVKAGDNYSVYGSKTSLSSWVTTGNEMTKFIDGQNLTAASIVKGLEKGVGMNDAGSHDAIFEMAVVAGDAANPHLLRPVRNPDPTLYASDPGTYGTYALFPADAKAAGIGEGAAADAVFANYRAAYDNWASQAYSTSPFPWTQLGYTYYWGQVDNVPVKLADVQGMSEFIMLGGTGSADPTKTPSGTDESGKLVAIGIYAPQSYLYTKNDGTSLSSAADAQYGNGFASFHVTGACDTLWAGAAFQAGAHLDAALPNTITIASGGTISGGQGLLVGSRNYTVSNAGAITANPDAKKFNLTGSENIALLFKGDMHDTPYLGDVKNILVNTGTIAGPGANGTAVAARAGDTEIATTGTITGTGSGYAVQTSSGNDVLSVNGGTVSGRIDLGTGLDRLTVRTGGTLAGEITTGEGAAVMVNGGTLTMTGGRISAGGMTGGGSDDAITISGGTVVGDIRTLGGQDAVVISGGEVMGGIDLGSDSADALSANNATLHAALSLAVGAAAPIRGMQSAKIADTGGVTIVTKIADSVAVKDQQAFSLVSVNVGGTLMADVSRIAVENDPIYPMIRFSAMQNGNSLAMVAARDGLYYSRNSGNASLGAALDSLANSASGDMAEVIGALDRSGNPADAGRLEPATRGIAQAGFSTAGMFSRAVADRMGDVMAEQSPGDGATNRDGLWGQTFVSSQRPESRDGYRLNVWGGSFGWDRLLFPRLLIGFGGGYAKSRTRSHDDQTEAEVESYQGNIYGSLIREAAYLDTIFSFAHNAYSASRHIVFGGLDRTARGDYTGRQYAGYLEGGYRFRNQNLEITPLITLQAVRLHQEEYAETGAGAANLIVEKRNDDFVQTGLGVKMAYPIRRVALLFTPELHAGIFHDFAGDSGEATARFAGGGPAFTATGCEPSRTSLNVGAKLTLAAGNNLTFSLGYDFETKADFTGHTGFLQIRYLF